MFCKYLPVEKMLGAEGSKISCFQERSKYLVLDAGGNVIIMVYTGSWYTCWHLVNKSLWEDGTDISRSMIHIYFRADFRASSKFSKHTEFWADHRAKFGENIVLNFAPARYSQAFIWVSFWISNKFNVRNASTNIVLNFGPARYPPAFFWIPS